MASLGEVLGFSGIVKNQKKRDSQNAARRKADRRAGASVLASGPGGVSLAAPDNSALGDLSHKVLGGLLGENNLPNDVLTNPLFIPGSDFKSEVGEDGSATFDFTQIGGQKQDFGSVDEFNDLSGDALLELVGAKAFNTPNRGGESTQFSPSLGNTGQGKNQGASRSDTRKPSHVDDANALSTLQGIDVSLLFDSASPEKQEQILELLNGT